MEALTRETLMSILDYNKETGIFVWKAPRNSHASAGSLAGCANGRGYIQIRYKDKIYLAHRLAWLFVYGVWPEPETDHINGIVNDNRIANLRVATKRENLINCKKHRLGHLVGATLRKHGKWISQINIDGKYNYLGMFDSEKEASDAYFAKLRGIV